jgi:hypothetical protein
MPNTRWVPELLRLGWCVGDDPIAKRVSVTHFSRSEGKILTRIYLKLEGSKAKSGTRDRWPVAEEWEPTPQVMSRNLTKTPEIFGLHILSSLQRSLKTSHAPAIALLLSASFGLGGRPPEVAACVTSASFIGKKGYLPVSTWYTVIPKT